jgi:hypothetical protein
MDEAGFPVYSSFTFIPALTGSSILKAGVAYTTYGKQQMIEQYAPARALTDWVSVNAPAAACCTRTKRHTRLLWQRNRLPAKAQSRSTAS